MKVAVLGTGSIGRRHLKGLSRLKEELKLSEIRCFDTNHERLDIVREEIADVTCTGTLEQSINGIDIVFMCVPTSLHIPIYEQIASMGAFHIFFEKPLSHTIEGCEKMLFDQARKGKKVAIGYMLHHHPVLKTTKEIIESGKLGRILSVRAECGYYLPKWHPWEDYRDFYMSWKTGGGGALLDISHEINYLQWIFGDIQDVQGMMGTISDLEISSDDIAVAVMKFKNGIIGQLHLDLLQFEASRHCKIIGTEGVMNADIKKNTITYNTHEDEEWKVQQLDVNFDEIYHMEYRNVISAFRGENGYIVTGDEAYKTMEVIEAIRRSNSYGVRVSLPLYN